MSDTQPDTGTEAPATDDQQPEGTDTAPDLAAEVEKWKAQARKHEDRAKANAAAAKELEAFKKASMSETEQAIAAAREEGRAEALKAAASGRVEDALRAAAAGRLGVDALLDGLDRSRFLTDDGEPDRDAIAAWVDRIAPKDDTPRVPDLGQGTRTQNTQSLGGDALVETLRRKVGAV